MKISLQSSSPEKGCVLNVAAWETILLACSRAGVILSAPCAGRQHCGKCKVQILEGKVSGDTPDKDGWVRSCLAIAETDIVIAAPRIMELTGTEDVIDILPEQSSQQFDHQYGVAIDIGTTTVSARLINLDTSQVLGTICELNDQFVFGADVMSRIGAAKNGKTKALFTLINHQTERIITTFKKRLNISNVKKLSVSGNTVMQHLFLDIDPSPMGVYPFTPVFLEEKQAKGNTLSLSAEEVFVLPSIAAFIGADITSGLAAIDIQKADSPSLLIDIGTNGEMALFNQGQLFCSSTAAGPVFEGAEISCGIGAVKGAISAVELTKGGGISITTLGDLPPVGVCGSGLVDAVAVMLKQEIIDETGLMLTDEKKYTLADNVSISAADIRQFQLAKSAIFSGIKILCKNAGVNAENIKNVFIAGGFGFFINKQNAVETGIFPQEFINTLSVCGNLSLQGAENYLCVKDFAQKCKDVVNQCTIVDLAKDPSFMDEFAENMLLNKTGISL